VPDPLDFLAQVLLIKSNFLYCRWYVVAGENPGNNKINPAGENNIPIIPEEYSPELLRKNNLY